MDNAYIWSSKSFKRLMEEKGMSCEIIADKLIHEKRWISTPLFVILQVKGFARDRSPLDLHQIIQLADILDVPLHDLLEKAHSSE